MRNSLRTTIGQFSNAEGVRQARAANARAVEPAADLSGAERGNLYMLVEVTGSGGGHAALYRQMLNAAQTAFYEAEGTLASALVRAVRSAHAVLRRANEALPEAGWRAGMSCVAFQGEELTIAQAGPALVLVGHPKTIDQFPAGPHEFTMPLGGEERPEVELIRTTAEPGSMILIVQSDWMGHVPPERLAAAAAGESVPQVVEYLGQLAGDADLSALVVGITSGIPEVQDTAPLSGTYVPPRGAPPPAFPSRVREPGMYAEHDMRPVSPTQPGAVADRTEHAADTVATWTVEDEATPALDEVMPGEEPVDETSWTNPPVSMRGRIDEDRPRRSLWPLVLALVIVPVLIGILVLSMWWLRNRANETQFQELLQGADTALTEAQGLPDEEAARQRMTAAQDFLDKAAALKPGDQRLVDVQTRYDEIMDRINNVTPLYGVVPLWDFKGADRQLDRVLVNNNLLFVLDRAHNEISLFTLSELGDSVTPANPPVVITKSQTLQDVVVGDLVDITWVDAVSNQRSKLLALDASGNLIGYDATWGAAGVPVAGREQWGYPQLISGYSGNLYVVDTRNNQIWRYRPTENGYDAAPEGYFADGSTVDLAGVQSIAIDGNIWLLYADGRLLKFFAGQQQAFQLSGLPDSLSSPAAVIATREGDLLYVADAGSGRIVEFTKEGQFTRQFRPAPGNVFKEMRSMYLDEANSVFYVLAGDKLYKADLPRPAQ